MEQPRTRGAGLQLAINMDASFHRDYVGFSDPDRDRSMMKDANGRYRLNIFREIGRDVAPPMYTMFESPKEGLPSAYQIYMYSESEYEAAMKLVGSWTHWQRLCNSNKFMNAVETESWTGLKAWREEKEVKDKAYAYMLLKVSAADGNVQAQKAVLEGERKMGQRGRPSKAQIEQAAKEAAHLTDTIKSDFSRIRLAAKSG